MSFFRKSITVKRSSPQSFSKGIAIPGTQVSTQILASVQPLNSQERLVLPEGIREISRFTVFTDYALRSEDKSLKTPGDIVVIENKEYTVLIVDSWKNSVIPHTRAVVGLTS